MSSRIYSARLLNLFVETVSREFGTEGLSAVLEKAGLPAEWASPAHFNSMDGRQAAEAYAGFQKALRTYYGRGARGILSRVGSNMWKRLLDNAPLPAKAQARIVRGLPVGARRKATLDLLAGLASVSRGAMAVHTMDLDLLLVDHASPGTLEQDEGNPICYLTQGMIREALLWSTGQEHDIEEISCRGAGEKTCEFKISIGG